MNKKGFTMFEVIVSVVLISLILTPMLATLVRIRESYEIVYENTDALIFSSSISRIVNNDFEKNGGIRYIDCNYDGNVCDITLNNNQKRRLEVYDVKMGHKVTKNDKLQILDENGKAISSRYVEETDNIYCEKVFMPDGKERVDGYCTITNGIVNCVCAKELLSTTLRYTDTTGGEAAQETSIYMKTLSLEKTTNIEKQDVGGVTYRKLTGKVTTLGYNFGRMSFTNLTFDSSNKKNSENNAYKNSVSKIAVEINDGIDTLDPTYNINFSSAASYDPGKTQLGKTICLSFLNYNPNATSITQTSDALCIKYGVSFNLKEKGILRKVEKLAESDLPVANPSSQKFKGFYYDLGGPNERLIIDQNGKILITTTFFEKEEADGSPIMLESKWGT